MKIKKHIINNPDYRNVIPDKTSAGVTVHLDGDNSQFEIKVVRHNTDNTENVLLWHKIKAQNIKQFGSGADFVVYGIKEVMPLVSDENSVPTGPYEVQPVEFVDIFSETLTSRAKAISDASYNKYPYYIFVDDQTSDFSTWTIGIRVPENSGYVFEGNLKSIVDSAQTVTKFIEFLPTITLQAAATMAPDSSATITVTTDPSVKEVFMDAVQGLINKQRVTLVNGVGTLTAYSTDLVSGDTVRVRAGYRKYPAATQVLISVQ